VVATEAAFVEFVVGQLDDVRNIRSRKMFGEYALYCDEKVVALICDDQVFVKPTDAGRAHIGEVVEAPAYPGATPSLLIDRLDDSEWFGQLIRVTADALPVPKPKKPRSTAKPRTKRG
jgi:TfoX/Sxy family transcriptional regulator of competence genes